MRESKFWILTIALVLALPTLALASHHYGKHGATFMMRDMSELDIDGNGRLDFDEYMAPNVEKWRKGFNMIDANNDGELTAEEWDAFLDVHGKLNS